MRAWAQALTPRRWLVLDAMLWLVATMIMVWTRFNFDGSLFEPANVLRFAGAAIAAQLAVGLLVGIYLRRFVPGSFEEAAAVTLTGGIVTLLLFGWTFGIGPALVPRSVPLTAGTAAVLGMLTVRFVGRAWSASRHAAPPDARLVVVFGAGQAGTQLVRQMLSETPRRFIPTALLDDDPTKRRLRVGGVRVRGGLPDLVRVAESTGAGSVVVAVPNADSQLIREVNRRADSAGLRVFVLPPLHEVMHRQVASGDLREVDVYDLLGRRPVRLEQDRIASSIRGRRVLVTGAGGSIGAELCRQIHRFGPTELIMLDRDESALHSVQLSLQGRALLDGDDTVLADIRDSRTIERLMLERRPDVVFHAAALKHLPLLEKYPIEAWKTNVVGTWNVLRAARAAGVATFVNISTDKAANPTNVLGTSKRVAERLTAAMGCGAGGRYVSVRFGNVLGSRGSVLTAFESQISTGGPVTVTHPHVSRFFMTIAEACQLVLQAATIGEDGEVLVLDMGEPVNITEVARTMIEKSGRADIDLIFTGLRSGEKLHEELFGTDEPRDVRRRHPLISHVPVPPLAIEGGALRADRFVEDSSVRTWLWREASPVRPEGAATAATRPPAVPVVGR